MSLVSKINRSAAAAVAALLLGSLSASHAFAASTIATVVADGTSGNPYTLNNVEVVGILNSSGSPTKDSFVLQDSTGSILDYAVANTIYTPTLGDIINLTATNAPYQDGAELTTNTGVSVVSQGNTVTIPVLTIPQFNAASNTTGTGVNGESIVTLDNVSFAAGTPGTLSNNSSYTLTDGTNTAVFYGYKSDSAVLAGLAQVNALGGGNAGPLNLTGYVDNYNGVSEFYVLSAALASPVPSPATIPGMLALAGLVGGATLVRRRLV